MIDLIVRHKGLYDVYISHYVTQSSSRPLSSEAGEGTGEAGERGKEGSAGRDALLYIPFPREGGRANGSCLLTVAAKPLGAKAGGV